MASVITEKHRWVREGILRVSDLDQIWRAPEIPSELHATILHLLTMFNIAFIISENNYKHFNEVPQAGAEKFGKEFMERRRSERSLGMRSYSMSRINVGSSISLAARSALLVSCVLLCV